jgi:hypothetical protein
MAQKGRERRFKLAISKLLLAMFLSGKISLYQ